MTSVHPVQTSSPVIPGIQLHLPSDIVNSDLPKTEEDCTYEKFKILDQPLIKVRFFTLCKLYISVACPSILVGITYMCQSIMITMGFYVCNRIGDAGVQSAFGLMAFLDMLIILSLCYPIMEKMSIACSSSFAEKNFSDAKRLFLQGCITNILIYVLIIFPFSLFSQPILKGMRILPADDDGLASKFFFKLTGVDVLRFLGEYIMAYGVCQKIEKPFSLANIASLAISGVAYYLCCFYKDMGVDGWFITRASYDASNVLFYAAIVVCKADKRSIGCVSLKLVFKGYVGFLKDCFKFVLSFYAEWLGHELSTTFTALTYNDFQISAKTSLANVREYFYCQGIGFSVTARTRINALLSLNKPRVARNLFTVYILGMMFTAALFGLATWLMTPLLSKVYSDNNEEIDTYLRKLLRCYYFSLFIDFLCPIMMTAPRCSNMICWNILLNIIFLLGVQPAVDILILKFSSYETFGIVICFYSVTLVIFVFLLLRLYTKEWALKKDISSVVVPISNSPRHTSSPVSSK
jgi:Na+-driven multidrug efflux pump